MMTEAVLTPGGDLEAMLALLDNVRASIVKAAADGLPVRFIESPRVEPVPGENVFVPHDYRYMGTVFAFAINCPGAEVKP